MLPLKKKATSFFLFLIIVLLPVLASPFMVVRLNLEQLTALAHRIFVGRCVSIVPKTDKSGRHVFFVTYEINDMIKGEKRKKITFKQLNPHFIEMTSMDELPNYRIGEEAVVFLSEESRLGFTAPIGLRQGRLSVSTDSQGAKYVTSPLGNPQLLLGMKKSSRLKSMSLTPSEKDVLSRKDGGLPYEGFISLVRKLAALPE